MEAFELDDVLARRPTGATSYVEFLRQPTLSLGVYTLPAGSEDKQRPHGEDEVYYVISGRGNVVVADERRPVEAGSLVFVGARIEHRFFDIDEDLVLLVFFAPAEGTQTP
jgi:mannose-6-phosphate isomerase-like protein (cupin superfamily)